MRLLFASLIGLLSLCFYNPSHSADKEKTVISGKIGYVLTHRYWAIYQTPGAKSECPAGMNDGPREQFKALFPNDGNKRTILETQLMREGRQWFPDTTAEQFKFKEATSKISYGMNLDDKVKENDFTSPDGEKGIDNQHYKAIGCIANYRAPEGTVYHFENEFMRRFYQNRVIIEITDVDNLENDDSVTVTSYRGRDPLLADASGSQFLAGGTQQIDMRWGKRFIQSFKGKIVDGVLITEGSDVEIPASATFDTNTTQTFRGLRFNLKLTSERAEGVMAGYVDVDKFINHLNMTWSTHHQSYGQLSSPSLYKAMRRLADGYPDPATGQMTAISSALSVKFVQAYLEFPEKQTAGIK